MKQSHRALSRTTWTVILVAAALLVILRFWLTLTATNQLYIDEIGSAVHADSLLQTGHDFAGKSWPVMAESFGGGYTTGVYLYPLTAWVWLFGDSAHALRAFSQFVTVAAVILVAYAAGIWRGKRLAGITLLVGLTLPWNWVGGSMAWDPAITPLFIALGLVCFSLLAQRKFSLKQQILLLVGMTASLVMAAYSYPPTRVTAPLLLIGALLFLIMTQRIKPRLLAAPIVSGAVLSIPLLLFMLSPGALERSAEVSVFHDSLIAGVGQIILNFLSLVDPRTLFVTGDPNLRHSTTVAGMLGSASVIAIVYAIVRVLSKKSSTQYRQFFVLAFVGIATGLLGSALTNQPYHYLRAVAAWPFFVLLISLGWEQISLHARPVVKYGVFSLAIIGSVFFIVDFSVNYPHRSAGWFQHTPVNSYEQSAVDYYNTQQR